MAMPSAMLKARGMATSVRTAGRARVKSRRSISAMDCIMKTPTMTRAGAVATAGMMEMRGWRKRARRKQAAVASAVRPVRPPASTPAADSM